MVHPLNLHLRLTRNSLLAQSLAIEIKSELMRKKTPLGGANIKNSLLALKRINLTTDTTVECQNPNVQNPNYVEIRTQGS